MVSMWRSKDDGIDSAKNNREPGGGTGVDERSRLLSQSPQESYLSPDDPAVSPYNL
ncbi:putative mitochondrial integral membrane protein [Golovinomyces cichoracearum]|uniref:Putative mitochondrial integral membrane protein n=1 Tax=Golovinomyces cichoracearum TaxID=62708 RepID=A0A420J4F0_9PEZI|nr:putative mitochondrial integral membrane protein [Golovinomyces cichoracearum]